MKDLLLLTHASGSSTGTTAHWCHSRDISYDTKVAPDFFAANVSDLDTYKGVIIFGGDMEAWEVDKYPWLAREKKAIRNRIQNQKSVFGICLGSQLLAEQLGAIVRPMREWEFGWFPVSVKNERALVPLHCHSSAFNLPVDCTLEASNEFDHVQGFSKGGHLVGYQFHTEIDGARLTQVLEALTDAKVGKIQTKPEIEAGFATYGDHLRTWYFTQLDQWWEQTQRE